MAAAMANAMLPSAMLDATGVPKRPRLELTPQQQPAPKPAMTTVQPTNTVQTTATAQSLHPSPSVATPLRIDTREAVKVGHAQTHTTS
jgi:hypothetical protein